MAIGFKYMPRMSRRRLSLSRLSDSQLVWLYYETGERVYFSELFTRYLPLVYGTCLKYIPQEEQAKSAVKRLYDDILERFDKTDFYGDVVRDWIYVNTIQFLENYVRENRIDERRFFSAGMQNTLSEGAFKCAALLENGGRTAHEIVENAKELLSKPENTCIEMFFLRRKSFRSIASSTGYLAGAVKKHIEAGLEKIARHDPVAQLITAQATR